MLERYSIAFLLFSALPMVSEAQTTHNLQYARHNSVTFTNADADRISSAATSLLLSKDSPSDVACNVTFRRSGNVRVFSNTDGIIDNVQEFVSVESTVGDVKVVRAINWCSSIGAGIIGCARVPGSSLLMVRFTQNQEGILMAHEFGHNQGLNHRNGTNNLMHPSIGTTRLGVNQAECSAFSTPARLRALDVGDVFQAQATEDTNTLDLVRTHYFHGFPVSIGLAIPPEDANLLIEIIRDREQSEWWPNAMAALALMGAEEASSEIRRLLSAISRRDLSDPLVFRALATAPIALGYYVNLSGDAETLDFLIEGANPSSASDGNFARLLPIDGDLAGIDEVSLAGTFIAGLSLAVTEDDRALRALEDVQDSQRAAFQSAVTDFVSQATLEYQRVRELGLLKYSEQ